MYSRATCKIWRHYLHFPGIHSSLFLFGSMDIQTKSCQELSSQHLGKKQKGTVIYIFGPTFSGSSFQPLLHWRINGAAAGLLFCVSTAYPAVDAELLENAVSWSLFLMHEVEQMAGIWNITQYVQHCNTVKEIPILSPQFILEPQVQENSRIFLGDVSNLVIHLVEYTQQLLSAYCQHIRGW